MYAFWPQKNWMLDNGAIMMRIRGISEMCSEIAPFCIYNVLKIFQETFQKCIAGIDLNCF